MREYEQYLTADGVVDTKEKSCERKGWTQIPYGIPHGVVVTHAAINIANWVLKLATRVNL